MKPWLRWIGATLIVSGYVACSPKKFSVDAGCENTGQNCITQDGRNNYDVTETIEGGKVDILIVDDNSASMSYEQQRLADRFNGFIASLENKNINYRIGVTTTDISGGSNGPRTINGNGALQDGRLISFANGVKYLGNDFGTLSQKDTAFKDIIKRPETLSCESFITNWINSGKGIDTQAYASAYQANCPSGDERGIYAMNLAVAGGADGMIRPEADLALIVLSDEDERSGLYCQQWSGSTCVQEAGSNSYGRADLDKSATFVSKMKTLYPQKSYAVHSIITRDATCLSQQNAQMNGLVNGSYGMEYFNLATLTSGVVGDICASDYTAQLQSIFNNITTKIVDKMALNCESPSDLTVTLTNNSDASISWSVVGKEVRFNKKLPVGTSVNLRYSCAAI